MSAGYTPLQIQAEAQRRKRERRVIAQSTTNAPPAPQWARENAQIVHPARGRILFEPYWYQHDFLASYHEPRRIILKARQIGFSQVFAIESLYGAKLS